MQPEKRDVTALPLYDRDRHAWVPQCPHGDVCTGCDARGYCTREESRNTICLAPALARDGGDA